MTALDARKNWLRMKTAPKQTMTATSGCSPRGGAPAAVDLRAVSLARTSIPQPASAPRITTAQGGTFQKASSTKAASPSARSAGVRMPPIQIGS